VFGDFSVLQGGSPVADCFCLTAEQMRERIVGSGELSVDRLSEALGLLKSPDRGESLDALAATRPTEAGRQNPSGRNLTPLFCPAVFCAPPGSPATMRRSSANAPRGRSAL